MMIDPHSEENSLAWSRQHRMDHIKRVIGRPAENHKATEYAVRFQSNRTRGFFGAINRMVDGELVVCTEDLRGLLADVDAERRFRGK